MDWISALLPAAIACIVLAAWFALYYHAMRPKSGTLEWIAAYDRSPFTVFRRWERLTVRRLWPALLCALLNIGVYFLNSTLYGISIDFQAPITIRILILQPLGAAALYLLLLQLDTPPLPATLAVIGILPHTVWHFGITLQIISILLLYRWATQPYNRNVFLLLAQGSICVLSFLLCLYPHSIFFLLGYLIVFCIVLVQRYRADGSILHLLRTILLAILTVAVCLVLVYLINYHNFYRTIFPQFWDGFCVYLQSVINRFYHFPPLCWDVKCIYLSAHYVLVLAGLLSLIAVWIRALHKKDFSALFLGILTVLAIPAWVVGTSSSGLYVLLTVCIAYTAGQLYHRGKRVLSLVLPVTLLLAEWAYILNLFTLPI